MPRTIRGIPGELLIGLGALVAAMLAVAVIVWVDIGHMREVELADDEAWSELAQDAAVIKAMVAQETALRGLAVTGDPKFRKAFEVSQRQFDVALQRLTVLAEDDPPAMRRLPADIALKAKLWTETVATPAIRSGGGGLGALRYVWAGQVQIDAIRADIGLLREHELKVLAERDVQQTQAFRSSRLTLVLGTALGLLFALLIAGRSSWRLIVGRREAEATAAKLADALERAHAAERAKTLFLSNMSHEMRTPLNGVVGMADALGRTRLDPGQRELLGVVRASAAALNGLIGDLLSLSRGDEAPARPDDRRSFHLGDAARSVAAEHLSAASLKGLRLLLLTGPEAEVRVIGDAARLRQLAACLISNALKFTDRGQVALTLAGLGADRYRFEVADTGIGFDEARKTALFETFTQSDDSATRRHGGAGLGLALARQLAVDLGGQLDCRSTLGEGSVFTFEIDLPSAEPQFAGAQLDAPPVDQAAAEDAPLRVLVVDDNATNRKLLEIFLDQIGVEWVSAEDGQQAVDAARSQAFAAILMDIQMPVMDGLTATREIRRLERAAGRAATPVIIVSANGEPEHIQAGRAAGAQLHLTKPVSAQALVDSLNAVLLELPAAIAGVAVAA